jgi:hypothetical protein
MAANPFAALDMSDDDDDTGTAVKQVAKAKEEPKAKAPKAKTDAKPAAARSEWCAHRRETRCARAKLWPTRGCIEVWGTW